MSCADEMNKRKQQMSKLRFGDTKETHTFMCGK